MADLANRVPTTTLASVAAAKARVEQHRAERALLAWGLASGAATALAAAGGLHVLPLLVATDPDVGVGVVGVRAELPVWVHALVTGLVVGSLTKPVHDLLSRVRLGAARRRDPPEG